jgi:hypothetical protein
MQGRRDEEPNKELGRELVRTGNIEGIQEIAENLWNSDTKIQSDCDGVMEEIGRQKPELIEEYVFDFLKLLSDKRNRRVWQAMICLSFLGESKSVVIFDNRETIVDAVEIGSVITLDNGINILARVASVEDEYHQELYPYLMEKLKTCRPKSVAQYAESIFCAVKTENREEYCEVLEKRLGILTSTQQRRVQKIIRELE